MSVTTDPRLQYNVEFQDLQPGAYPDSLARQPADDALDGFDAYALNRLANASVTSNPHHLLSPNGDTFTSPPRARGRLSVQSRGSAVHTPRAGARQANRGGQDGTPTRTQNKPSTQPGPSSFSTPTWNATGGVGGGVTNSSGGAGPSIPASFTHVQQLLRQDNSAQPPTSSPGMSPSTPHQITNGKEEGGSHFSGMKLIPDPPDLAHWREKLFDVDGLLTLTSDEFQTYFPHVDNVYSHRSTQKYKRKPFVSHYWDCRLKGRPPGTPKSDDPNKKKRKRLTRERDLCDVKIKITEYFATTPPSDYANAPPAEGGHNNLTFVMANNVNQPQAGQAFGVLEPSAQLPPEHPGANGARYFTIQRVSGNNNTGEKDGEVEKENNGGSLFNHRHTLADSDRIKKNSVQRWQMKEEKELKRQQQLELQVSRTSHSTPTTTTARRGGGAGGKTSRSGSVISSSSTSNNSFSLLRSTGVAHNTAKLHSVVSNPATSLTFFCNAYCPFAQRVWIALEVKQIPYRLVEVIPSATGGLELSSEPPPADLLEVCPEGHIPCIRHGNWGIWESGVMLEYLEDLDVGLPLLPLGKPQLRAHCRLWADHINRKVLPSFYALLLTPPATGNPASQLQNMTSESQALTEQHLVLINTLQTAITALVNASHQTGPFFLGSTLSFVDIAFAPWIIRLSRVLSFFRGFPRPEVGTRWQQWVDAVEADERVRATVSEEGSYHNVYRGVGTEGWNGLKGSGDVGGIMKGGMVEVEFARRVVREEGFGLGGDVWGGPQCA